MGPILVVGVGLVAILWFSGWLSPRRLRWIGAAIAGLAGLRMLAMGQMPVAAALFLLAGWLGHGARVPTTGAIDEARRRLGVSSDAGEADINAAYRRLMAEAHPDKGGSEDASRAINAARDTLLKHLHVNRR